MGVSFSSLSCLSCSYLSTYEILVLFELTIRVLKAEIRVRVRTDPPVDVHLKKFPAATIDTQGPGLPRQHLHRSVRCPASNDPCDDLEHESPCQPIDRHCGLTDRDKYLETLVPELE